MKKIRKISIFFLSVFLFGCASQRGMFSAPELSKNILKPPVSMSSVANYKEDNKSQKNEKINIVYIPTVFGKYVSWSGKSVNRTIPSMSSAEKALKISVENMPLSEFVKLVFGKILGSNYFIGKKVENNKSKITLEMASPVTRTAFLDIVTAVLSKYNVSIKEENGVYFINYGNAGNKSQNIKFFVGRSISSVKNAGRVCDIAPLYYINGNYYSSLIKRFSLSSSGFIAPFKKDAMIICDSAPNVKEALKLVNLFDRPSFSKKIAVLVGLNYISPEDFVRELKNTLPLEGIPIANSVKDKGILIRAMDSLSSVLVVSPKKEWIKAIYFWRSRLDSLSSLGNQPRFFVYYPKNRRADELEKVFSKIVKNMPVSGKEKNVRGGKFSISDLGDVKVVVDESRNALVILCTPSEYKYVKMALDKLDTLPKQVFVQVSILEVTLAGKLDYGLEWYLRHSGKFNGILQTMGGLGLGNSGLNYSVVTDTAKFMSVINAFAQKKLINVLSSPSLVVLDNKEASINVGTEVPVVTSESTDKNIQDNGTTALVRTIQYRSTGVILHIKPTINSNGIVTMTVSQEVSDAQTNDISPGIDSPLILTRSISTTVTLKSGTTLLLGGLIKKSRSNTVNKVPLLGDLPILGNLFKTTAKGTTKTELIVEITPYILSNMTTAEKVTNSYKKLMDLFNDK